MWQEAARRLLNRSYHFQVRKVASLLAQPLREEHSAKRKDRSSWKLRPTSCPLYVARGRRIGCEGAIDRLPHGPSSAQRPLNSEGRRAPLTDRESPNSCPGRRPSRRAPIGKAGPRMEGSSQMTQTPTYYAGIDVAKDRLDVVLRPSGEYMEATNDERGIRSVVRRLRKENVALAVLEATGGLEQPAAALALAGVPVAIVNPRQLRDFAKATGKLAKTDRIDAAVLAHFAEAVKPEPRPLADEHARELSAVVLRRRQILAMTTAEANRARTAPKAVRKRIEAHLRWLRKELAWVDGELERVVKESLVWKEKAVLLMSVPGVGPTLSATLLAELPELEHLDRRAARHAGRGGAPQPGLRHPARDTHRVGRSLGGEDDPLHGHPVRHPPQSRPPRVLWTPGGLRQAEKGSAHGLHEEATDHPGRDLTEQDPLAAAGASDLLGGAAARARRSLEGAKELAKPLDPT